MILFTKPLRHFLLILSLPITTVLAQTPKITATDAATEVNAGRAFLVDVREPEEWQEGVAAPAVLLSLSELRGDRQAWTAFLDTVGDKTLLLYCRSGNRSGQAAAILEKEGFRVANAGAFKDWAEAGLPTRRPEPEKKD